MSDLSWICWVRWGTVADWLVATGTLIVAVVAVFQDSIRARFYRPNFRVSTKAEPPDCVAVPFTDKDGGRIADSIYLRIWVENIGNATAESVEVYAKELHRQREDGRWETVSSFPNMNLVWSNIRAMLFPSISPEMGKHCDVGHITDPASRHHMRESNPRLHLATQQTSLAFDLIATPNNRNHIIGPGEYRLEILVAAKNARPIKRTIAISLSGTWDSDETTMLRDHVRFAVLPGE